MKYNASKLRNCVLYPVVRPTANKKLFCFPFAGNGASIYLRWAERISDNIEVCPIELPGRGRRFRDPLLHRFSDVIESLSEAILPHLNKPFAFFGHSMGA
ncbi:MAG: thioesterase II family protein, partial [Methanococcaceae archaeon]